MPTFRIVYGYSNRSNQGTNKTFQIVVHKGEKCKMLEEKKKSGRDGQNRIVPVCVVTAL